MLEEFTNRYKVSKTLRFKLIPQGETLDHIRKRGIIEEDEKRDTERRKVQALADKYHRSYIDKCLEEFTLEGLEEYIEAFNDKSKSDERQAALEASSAALIKQISSALTSDSGYKSLSRAELYQKILPEMYKNDKEALASLSMFDGFTTYFGGYNKTREYIYNDSGDKGTIGNRLINENLPTFLRNARRMHTITERAPEILEQAEKELKEMLDGKELSAMSETDYFNSILTQKGIDLYNQTIGGYTLPDGQKVRGLNEFINMYNQKVKDKNEKLPRLTQLRKMILSEETTLSFIPEKIQTDEELLQGIKSFEETFMPAAGKVKELISDIREYDLSGIHIRSDAIRVVSDAVFNSWKYIQERLADKYDEEVGAPEKKRKTKKYKKEKDQALKQTKTYPISYLDSLPGVEDKVSAYLIREIRIRMETAESAAKELAKKIEARSEESRSLKRDDKMIAAIKGYLDAAKAVRALADMLMADASDRDEAFYSEMDPLMDAVRSEKDVYNKTRNYITSKPYTKDKIKLNFGSSVFLEGWSESVESVKLGTILLKEGKYYLGIIAKGQGNLFAKLPEAKSDDVYQKMIYTAIPGAGKTLPHVCFSRKGIEEYKPSDEVLRIYREGTFKKGKNFNIEDCRKLIDFYKNALSENENWKCFDFRFSDTKTYEDISGFYREVDAGGYSLEYRKVDTEVIDCLVSEGKLYLFEIWHRDFSPKAKGKPDLSTIYWRALFDPENRKSRTYKLNGGAELFFREASIKEKDIIRHKAGKPVEAKNPLTKNKSKVLHYDIIKDKRYTEDSFHLNVPVTMNAAAPDFINVNTEARVAIKRNGGCHVIGVSRGEKSLIHITVLDPEGNIIESRSLNIIESKTGSHTAKTDYAKMLAEREAKRDQERKSWNSVQGIKQLKDGYLSMVIKEITDLMLKYDAVIAIEDLSSRFKQKRQKIEKAVYQQLEAKLIRKLNYLVEKDAGPNEPGGAFKAYQMTLPFQGFDKIGRQTGFVFYVSPWNTTAIDPETGFCNLFDTRYHSIAKSSSFWHTFDRIVYDKEEEAYRFDFDYMYFVNEDRQALIAGTKTKWSVYSKGKRIRSTRNDKGIKTENVDLTKAITALFEEYGIKWKSDELQAQICSVADKNFHEELLALFRLTVRLRNGSEIISPVRNRKGEFFSGDADANGSLNIARKGLMLVNRIKESDNAILTAKANDKNIEKIDLFVNGNDYLKYMQN